MSSFVIFLAPTLGKIILGHFFGKNTGTLAGSILSFASERFKETREARDASSSAQQIGEAIAAQLDAALNSEGATEQEKQVLGRELVDTLEETSMARLVVASRLNEEKLANELKATRTPVALSARETGFYEFLLRATANHLRTIAPALDGYIVERDSDILGSLRLLANKAAKIESGQLKLADALDELDTKLTRVQDEATRERIAYERQYLAQSRALLDYVEILGLDDLDSSRREVPLSVAYLSLTMSSDRYQSSDFSDVLNSLVATGGRLVIEGGAGSGKSTLLRWAAINAPRRNPPRWMSRFLYSTSRKENKLGDHSAFVVYNYFSKKFPSMIESQSSIYDEIESQGLKEYLMERFISSEHSGPSEKVRKQMQDFSILGNLLGRESDIAERSEDETKPTIPILVRLRGLDGNLPKVDDLPLALSTVIPRAPQGWMERVLEEGRALILFDGVDEVPDGDQRDNIIRQISEYSKSYPKCAVIVTSRPHAFDVKSSTLADFDVALVNDLDREQQKYFVQNWHAARATKVNQHNVHVDYQSQAQKLLDRFETSPPLARLAANPLLCAAICALYDYSPETLPEDERQLCEKLTEMLAYKRDLAGGRDRGIDLTRLGAAYAMAYAKKKPLLARLAAEMLRAGVSQLKRDDALRILPSALSETGQAELKSVEVLGRGLISGQGCA